MYSILISIALSCVFVAAGNLMGMRASAITFYAIVGLIVPQVAISLVLRKTMKAKNEEMNDIIVKGQKQLNNSINQLSAKSGGNIKLMQKQLENGQQATFKKALDFTASFEPYKKWNILMGRQIDTMRLQFNYYLKNFDAVDELLAKGKFKGPLLIDPMTVCLKMARQYKNKDLAGVEKTFNWHIKFFRGTRGTIIYALVSWIFVKEGEIEKARQILAKGKDSTANETLAKNWELLSNGKEKQFSNADLGDEWYGLALETPKTQKMQRVRGNANGHRHF